MILTDPAVRAERAAEKRRAVLTFLADEVYSTADNIGLVVGLKTPRHVSKLLSDLQAQGLTKAAPGPTLVGQGLTLWGITPQGRAMTPDIDPLGSVFEPSRLALSTIPHTLALQSVRLRCQAAGWRSWERTRGSFNQPKGEARPDAIAKTSGGQTVAIEVENSLKSAKRYQSIFAAHLRAIQAGQYVGVFYVSPGPVAKGLERILAAIKTLPGGVPFDQARRGRFEVREIDSFP